MRRCGTCSSVRLSWLFFGANLMLQVSHGPYYSFFVLYLQQLGYSESLAGYQIALGVIAEVLIFLKAGALLTRLGARNLLLVSMALSTLRWLLTPLVADNLWLLSACQLLHAASFGTAHAASMQFLHHWFRGKHRGKGQALYASLSFGIGGALGALASGYLWLDGRGGVDDLVDGRTGRRHCHIDGLADPRVESEPTNRERASLSRPQHNREVDERYTPDSRYYPDL